MRRLVIACAQSPRRDANGSKGRLESSRSDGRPQPAYNRAIGSIIPLHSRATEVLMALHADPNPEPASCPDTSEYDMHPQTWSLDPTRILTRRELTAVLADARKTSRYANSRRNLVA